MYKTGRDKLVVNTIVFALVFCLTSRPTLNAADPSIHTHEDSPSLAKELLRHAGELRHALHERPLEQRGMSDYRRALDAYGQVTRLNTDTFFSAESLARMAELQREMADARGDSAFYQQAIESFRKVVDEHPQSVFVGDALVSIAQIYEENLQDLDGAAAAYGELIDHFPQSVMAREARAVLSRFEAQLKDRPVDVLQAGPVTRGGIAGGAIMAPRLTNVRSFGGPDYARVVIDLSDTAAFVERRAGNRLTVHLDDAVISNSLYGRRFIVGETSLLKRIIVSAGANSTSAPAGTPSDVRIEIEVGSLSDYSLFSLSAPERIVIDLHAAGLLAKTAPRYREAQAPDAAHSGYRILYPDHQPVPASSATGSADSMAKALRPNRPAGRPLLDLPEITDPILPFSTSESHNPAAPSPGAATEAKADDSPIKCVVIDPGHGGHDTGTIGSNGMREKDLVLDVARRLKAYIKRNYPEIEVIMTRDSDRFIALEERTAIANSRRADLFISIHANASESRVASGVETYFLSPDRAPSEDLKAAARENARFASEAKPSQDQAAKPAPKAEPVYASVTVGNRVAESRELARYIQSGLVRGIGAASPRTAMNRGVKHAPFVVLLGAAMPSVLAEVSFVSNPRDEALLQTTQFRERIAASLFAGLNAYLKKNRANKIVKSEK